MESTEKYSQWNSPDLISTILDTAIDGIIIIDERGIIQLVNKAVEELFYYSQNEMIGQNIRMLMPSPYRDHHDQYIENYHRSGHKKIIGIGREVTAIKKDGEIFPIRLAVSEFNMKGNRFYTGILHDITKQKKAEDKLQKLNTELEAKINQRTEELADAVERLLKINQEFKREIAERIMIENDLKVKESELKLLLDKEKELNQLKSRFVSMASHEFRTPLSTILSSATLIEKYTDQASQDKRLKHINKIKNAVNNLTSILNDFLSLEKLEVGSIQPKYELVQIGNLCSDLSEELQAILKAGQKLEFSKSDGEIQAWTDLNFLQNALINIISNAIKYSPEGKTIQFQVIELADTIKFVVQDEGIGIPASERELIFSRFFRAKNATNIQGTGLGLHIVKRYMELLGGFVRFESEENIGSKFELGIPKNIPENPSASKNNFK